MKKIMPNVFLFLISIISTLFIGEGLIRRFRPQLTYSKAISYSFDCFEPDPDQPFTLPRSHTCRMNYYLGDFNVTATTNSLGYRNREFTSDKPAGVTRILFLGDSMTFGHGLADDQTYPYKIQQILDKDGKKTEIINAGYADGFSIDSYYVYLKNRGMALKPDAVIVGFFVFNDIEDLSETVWPKTDDQGLPQQVTSCCMDIDNHMQRSKSVSLKYRLPYLRESQLFVFLVNLLEQRGIIKPPKGLIPKSLNNNGCIFNPGCISIFSEEEEKVFLVIRGIKSLTDSAGIPLIFILLPGDVQLYPEMGAKYSNIVLPKPDNVDFIQKRLSGYLRSQNIKVLDLYPAFLEAKSRGIMPFYYNDAHLNREGSSLVAASVSAYLREMNIIK